jgi:hypothetical protein
MFSNIQHISEAMGHRQLSIIKILRENNLYINIEPVLKRRSQFFFLQRKVRYLYT